MRNRVPADDAREIRGAAGRIALPDEGLLGVDDGVVSIKKRERKQKLVTWFSIIATLGIIS